MTAGLRAQMRDCAQGWWLSSGYTRWWGAQLTEQAFKIYKLSKVSGYLGR